MKVARAIVLLVLTGVLIYVLNTGIGNTSIPAMGRLMSPFTGIWQAAENNEYDNIEVTMALQEPVSVRYDHRLVPHIQAQNLEDAIQVQGYIEASQRLWQMELSVRAAAGELSEVLGTGKNDRVLKKDLLERRKGAIRAAKLDVEAWKKSPKTWAICQAYAAGVNAYINSLSPKDYPIEYKLLGVEPRPWTLLHSALFAINMANTLSKRNYDVEDTNFGSLYGEELYKYLYMAPNEKQSPVIPTTHKWNFEGQKVIDTIEPQLSLVPHQPAWQDQEGIGSNNWAINGDKTASGYPILCNDPHLNLTLPSIWFEMQINLPDQRIHGATIPGIPGIVIGFNDRAAWGTTNVGQDVLDWYKIDWVDDSKNQYWLDNQKIDVEKVVEKIKVKDQAPVIDTVRYTYWGPVVYRDSSHPKYDLAMKWVANMAAEPEEPIAFVNVMQTSDVSGFLRAMEDFTGPAQNFIFASIDNDIAIQCRGNYPIRRVNQGVFVQEGNTTDNDWLGIIPDAHIPMDINPERDFVSSANQKTTDETYPYFYFGGFENYRGRLVNRYLDAIPPGTATAKSMKAMQTDNYSIEAEEVAPFLINQLLAQDSALKNNAYVQALIGWNYRFDAKEKAPSYFVDWWKNTRDLLWDEITTQRAKGNYLRYPKAWRSLALLQQDPTHPWVDNKGTPQKEDVGALVKSAFEKTIAHYDTVPKAQHLWHNHLNQEIASLSRMNGFGVKKVVTGGYRNAINANKGLSGPSWRMVVELGPQPKGHVVYPGGQSGNPGSPFYHTMIDDWSEGEYHIVNLMDDVEQPLYVIEFKTIEK